MANLSARPSVLCALDALSAVLKARGACKYSEMHAFFSRNEQYRLLSLCKLHCRLTADHELALG